MATFIVRVFVPLYVELEANDAEEAQRLAQAWYREQKDDWHEPTTEVMPLP